MLAIPLGALKALVNALVWVMNGLCFCISSHMYERLSGYMLSNTGKTVSTDSSEVIPLAWVFGHFWARKRLPAGWVLAMLVLNLVLFPLEILLEAGTYQHRKCSPHMDQSRGVCASKWNGQSPLGIVAAALSAQRMYWGDRDWSFVAEGSTKIPDSAEVRGIRKFKANPLRRYVAHQCKVQVSGCPSAGCGVY